MRWNEITKKVPINREKKRTKHGLGPGEPEQQG